MWSSDPCEGLTICRAVPLFHPDLVLPLVLNLLPPTEVQCFIDRATCNSVMVSIAYPAVVYLILYRCVKVLIKKGMILF